MACPLCQKPENPDYAPFCSSLCKNKDLLNWINEEYRIPVSQPDDSSDGEPESSDPKEGSNK